MTLMASELLPVLKAFGANDAQVRIMTVNGVELKPEGIYIYSEDGEMIVQIMEKDFLK